MSQHHFTTPAASGEPLYVVCGYDNPLNHFFLSIEPCTANHPNEALYYESLEVSPTGGLRLDELLHVLNERHLVFPRGLNFVLERDKALENQNQQRNKRTTWPLSGIEAVYHDFFVDTKLIESCLANDEYATDTQVLTLLTSQVKVIPYVLLSTIIMQERPWFRRNCAYQVDWDMYLPTVVVQAKLDAEQSIGRINRTGQSVVSHGIEFPAS